MEYDKNRTIHRIRTARIENGLKQSELCELLGITQPAYSRIETGQTDLTVDMLFKISKVLNAPVEWFLGMKDGTGLSDKDYLALRRLSAYAKKLD